MRKFLPAAAIVILIGAAIIAREGSTGKKLLDTSRNYMEFLSEGDTAQAYLLLSDSLAALLTPEFLEHLESSPAAGRISAGNSESRGFTVFISLDEGGSRTLWLRKGQDSAWKISGDSSLDNLFGTATLLCSSYAMETVIPALSEGGPEMVFYCPVSGSPYYIENGNLICPAGHLGNGLDTEGFSCGVLRDSLAQLVSEYLLAGYDYPASFAQMYENSSGEFGLRGGFRCPDNGYSYFEITEEGIYCPFHSETSTIPGVEESQDSTSL
jgi:hypothetical protein